MSDDVGAIAREVLEILERSRHLFAVHRRAKVGIGRLVVADRRRRVVGMFRGVPDVQTMDCHRRIGRPGPAPARATTERANLDHIPVPGNRLSKHLDSFQLGLWHPSGNVKVIWHWPLARCPVAYHGPTEPQPSQCRI